MNPSHEVKYDREAARAVVKTHLADIRTCYDEGLKINPHLKGKFVFDWEIVDEGFTRNAKISEKKSDTRNSSVENCLIALISAWRFPPPPPRNTVDISYPFFFKN